MSTPAISGKVNLSRFKHAIIATPAGDEAIVIPIKANHLFKSDVGNVYFDFIGWPKKTEDKDGNSHIVKQSLPKVTLDSLTDEQKKELPIFGNLKPMGGNNTENAPTTSDPDVAAAINGAASDLPF